MPSPRNAVPYVPYRLQALYGPAFKADTSSDMLLALNGVLHPDVFNVRIVQLRALKFCFICLPCSAVHLCSHPATATGPPGSPVVACPLPAHY